MAAKRESKEGLADLSRHGQILYKQSSESLSGSRTNSFQSCLNLILRMTTLGVGVKDVFHIRFHPRVAEELKSRKGPRPLPLVPQCLGIAGVYSQPAAAQIPPAYAGEFS